MRRPCNQVALLQRFHKLIAHLESERGGNVTAEEVVEQLGTSKSQGDALLGFLQPVVHLDRPAFEVRDRSRDSRMTIADVHLVDPVGTVIDERLDQKTLSDELTRHLERLLTPRENKVIGLYFGFGDNEP